MKKTIKYGAMLGAGVGLLYFLPKLTLFYAACGLYDVGRNRPINGFLLKQYFVGNGVLTWLLSPINILLDILSLPYINKGIYKLDDLPGPWRDEVTRLIHVATREKLVEQLEQRATDGRTMIFFKWYGENRDTFIKVPEFHEQWNYIQTIGVSIFNKKVSTSKHFGPLRPTLRVLYNLNDITDRSAYITVGDHAHYWQDEKLFIFDDTLMHQSINETDKVRYCLFVDMVRPSLATALLRPAIAMVNQVFRRANHIFYNKWKVIQ
ncbi:MAG TPA: aspartyl/asparaginyl beta-hydroxylase domain-containing protein [Pseudolabrys sp.]|nr:aspartyl/asparaginyl beta-hydroxylase domain-containing protein [Pseudolabrys sp.]